MKNGRISLGFVAILLTAFLALAGRPNVSGEPYQGSSARFVLEQAETLGAGRVCFCHHDPE